MNTLMEKIGIYLPTYIIQVFDKQNKKWIIIYDDHEQPLTFTSQKEAKRIAKIECQLREVGIYRLIET